MKRVITVSAAVITAMSLGIVAAGATQVAHSTTPSVLTCAGTVVVRPTSYILSCADANSYFKPITWKTWGKSTATASGTFVENTCEPDCAAGKFESYPATIELSKPTSTKLGLLFADISYTYDVSESSTLPLTKMP